MESALHDGEPRLPERSLGDVLNETFVIYGRHFTKFLGIAAAVQIPATATLLLPVGNLTIYIILNLISLFALVTIFGATIYAVGQHYVTDSVTVVDCYKRLLWRGVSMLILGAIVVVITGFGVLLLVITPVGGAVLAVLILAALTLTLMLGAYVVPALAGPVVIVEGIKAMGALNRMLELVSQSELRIVGHLAVYFLVALGLSLVLFLPFFLFFPSETGMMSRGWMIVSGIVPALVAPPVMSIAITLLYYDLRVRKEGFDIKILSQEMGLVPS
jgi:hypothetical protein